MATAKELAALSDADLTTKLNELRQAKFDKKLSHRIGELQNSSELSNTKKDLARALTVQRARAIKAKAEAAKSAAPAATAKK
jgi:ribosomal protein L29